MLEASRADAQDAMEWRVHPSARDGRSLRVASFAKASGMRVGAQGPQASGASGGALRLRGNQVHGEILHRQVAQDSVPDEPRAMRRACRRPAQSARTYPSSRLTQPRTPPVRAQMPEDPTPSIPVDLFATRVRTATRTAVLSGPPVSSWISGDATPPRSSRSRRQAENEAATAAALTQKQV